MPVNGGPNVGTAVSVLLGGSTIETDESDGKGLVLGTIPDGPKVIAEVVSVGADPGVVPEGADPVSEGTIPGTVLEGADPVSVGADPGAVPEGAEPKVVSGGGKIDSVETGTSGTELVGSIPVGPNVIALSVSAELGLAG